MYKLKYLILIFFMILMSFLLCAAVPPPERIEHNFDLSLNIPDQHKIKIIILGKGSLFINNEEKKTGDIITCRRFSNLSFSIKPDDNHTIDKIDFNNENITSNLSSNTLTLSNINSDGTLTVYFKPKTSASNNKSRPSDNIKEIVVNINNNIIAYINQYTNISNYIKTNDSNTLLLLIPLIACFIYIIYFIQKKFR